MGISVVIQTYNSEQYLERVLNSVMGFDEIIICDMYSSDCTIDISTKYNCRIVYHKHTGIVEPARNFAISQASHEWVLVVDSDEIITDDLREYLYKFIARYGDTKYAGLRIPRKNYFMRRFMHADYPDYILRFVRKSKVDWPGVIHSIPIIDGNIFTIPASQKKLAIDHLSDMSLEDVVTKYNTYTNHEVQRNGTNSYSLLKVVSKCTFHFLRFYFFKGGYKDGREGFARVGFIVFYKFLKIVKIWEQQDIKK